jgi:hypothetical protein
MRARWIVALALASGCVQAQDNLGRVESAVEEEPSEEPPPDQAPPPPDGSPPSSGCESGSEYEDYYCCMQIVGDAAYCEAMNGPPPPFDLGEAAPAQTGGTIAVPDSGSNNPPPPTTTPPPGQVTCEEDPDNCSQPGE